MSPKVRDSIYIALAIINTALLTASEQSLVPTAYAHYVALASVLVAAMLPKFMAPTLLPAPAPVPAAPPPGAN